MRTRAISALVCVLVLGGCGGSRTGLQREDPAKALTKAGAAVGKLNSVSATLKFSKGTLTFRGYSLVSAQSAVRLPDTSDTTYKVRQGDSQFDLKVVITEGRVYLRVPFAGLTEVTGKSAADIPDLARLFDVATGLPAVIPNGRNLKYIAADRVDGVDSHKIEGTYSPEQIHGMLPQLNSAGDVDAFIWVGGSDHLIRKAVLSGPFGDNGAAAAVEVDLGGFDKPVVIASPSV